VRQLIAPNPIPLGAINSYPQTPNPKQHPNTTPKHQKSNYRIRISWCTETLNPKP
jgi:hypothetical protein